MNRVMGGLGPELRRLRLSKGYSLEKVAEEIGVTKQYMSLIETGQRKSVAFEIMFAMADFYDVPIDYFGQFVDGEQSTREPLSEEELHLWNEINHNVQEQIFYKRNISLMDWIRSAFKS